MKRLAQSITLALLLQILLQTQFVAFAQNPAGTQKANDTAYSAGSYQAQLALFDEFVRQQMAIDKTPGLTIGFLKDEFVWVKGYGFSDLENKVPASAKSAYRLASVSKSMTAVAIMQLVEKGKINLDAEVQTYVPYFPKKQWPVTTRQLLGHLGGISHYKNADAELHIKDHKTTREAVAIFENFDLIAEPGTRYSYSSYGYNLLGAIVEAASGISFGEYMRQNVWGPAGMNDTRLDDPVELIPNRVRGYRLMNGQVRNSEFVDISSRFAAGGARATVPDLLRYASAILKGKLLSPESWALMTTSMSTREGRLTNYGMGWQTTPFSGRFMLVHSGGQQETATLLYLLPRSNLALAIAMNFESGNASVYLDRLFQLLTGSPRNLPIYSPDKTDAALLEALNSTFNYGLAYFDKWQRSASTNPAELDEAFLFFNTHVDPDAIKSSEETLKKIREGVHPASKQAFVKVGSYIAEELAKRHSPAKLQSYVALGGPVFFQDYLALTASETKLSKLNPSFSTFATQISKDWGKANTTAVRQLWLTPNTDLDALGKTLRASFAGAKAYPNLVDPLFSVTRHAVLNRDFTRALKAGQLAAELYPDMPLANFSHGIALILSGDTLGAQSSLKKTAAADPTGVASANGLNNVASQLAQGGLVDEGIQILKTAIALYPHEANLHDSLGGIFARQGRKPEALESYKKALELNPDYSNAANAKEMIKKLSGGKD